MRSHRREQVTLAARDSNGRSQREFRSGELVSLADPELALSVDEPYEGIDLSPV